MNSVNAVNLIGALTYRTSKALNVIKKGETESEILKNVKGYKYWENMFHKNEIHLWHYPGTQNEILETWGKIQKDQLSAIKRYPAILNYQNIRQERGRKPGMSRIFYQLAIVAPVDSQWTTQQRNDNVFQYVLRPIYDEFIRQIDRSGWFEVGFDGVHHSYTEVFTTGTSYNQVIRMQYGDYLDAIQLTDLRLDVKLNMCIRDAQTIEKESRQVTDALFDILQTYKN